MLPLSNQPPTTLLALVRIEARSEPESGSDMPMQKTPHHGWWQARCAASYLPCRNSGSTARSADPRSSGPRPGCRRPTYPPTSHSVQRPCAHDRHIPLGTPGPENQSGPLWPEMLRHSQPRIWPANGKDNQPGSRPKRRGPRLAYPPSRAVGWQVGRFETEGMHVGLHFGLQ